MRRWRDGDFKGARTTKYIMEESHSKHAEMLARTNPLIAAAILREINDGVQKFHDGIYGGELFLCEKKLAEDIDQELNREKEGSFFNYRDKFLNFSVVIGNMGYCGDIPCFGTRSCTQKSGRTSTTLPTSASFSP